MSDKLAVVDITDRDDYDGDQVGPGKRVCLHFSLALTGGEIIDSNFDREGAWFTVGDGSLLPGFENALFGLRPGARETFELPPAQAFGHRNDANVHRFERRLFPPEQSLEKGVAIAFTDGGGHEQTGVVLEADKDMVTIDFNHPLSGRTIVFTVEVIAVEAKQT